jgi:hypothetical protein
MTKQSTVLITPMSKEVAESWCLKIGNALEVFPKGMFSVKAGSSFNRENAYGLSLESKRLLRQKWCQTELECEAVYIFLTSNTDKARFVFDL